MTKALECRDILERVQELRQQRAPFVRMANENEKMWKLELFERDAETVLKDDQMMQITSPVARNTVNLALRLMSVTPKIEIPSIDSKRDRDDRAELLERWLTAFWERSTRQTGKMLIRNQNWNVLALGGGGYYVQWVKDSLPEKLKTTHLPISIRVLDPRNMGVAGNPYFAEHAYHVHSEPLLSAARRYPALKTRFPEWESNYKRHVEVVDFWWRADDGGIWNAVLVENQFVLEPEETLYPDIPIIEVLGDSTPLEQHEWRSLSINDPIRETWRYSSRLMSQVATGLLNLFTPPLLAKTKTGAQIPDLAVGPNAITKLSNDVQLDALHIQPNAPLAQMMIGIVQGMIDQSTFPIVMYGDSGNMTAGFGVSILADQARGRIASFMENGEMGLERTNALVLALVDKLAGAEGVEVWGRNDADSKMYRTTLKPSDINGNYENMVSLQPQIPQDNIQRETLALRFGEAKVWSWRTIRDRVMSMATPSDEDQRIALETARQHPDIQNKLAVKAIIDGYPDEWMWMVQGTPLEMQLPPKERQQFQKWMAKEAAQMQPGMGAMPGQMSGQMPGQTGSQAMPPNGAMPPGAPPMQGAAMGGQMSPQMPPQPSPQEQLMMAIQSGELGPDQLIAMLQSGELSPDMLPPEVLQMLEQYMAQQGQQQPQQGQAAPSPIDQLMAGIQSGQIGPEQVMALLQSGEITPDMLPPELLAMLEQYMQQQGAQSQGMVPGMGAAMQGQLTPQAVGVTPQMAPGTYQAVTGQPMGREEELDRIMGLPREMR